MIWLFIQYRSIFEKTYSVMDGEESLWPAAYRDIKYILCCLPLFIENLQSNLDTFLI